MYLDAKLHWHKHQRIILQKAQRALSSLSTTSYSTWGFPVLCCGLYRAVLTEYRIKGEMRKVGWFSQERSVKECEGVWWNVVVVTPDQ